MVNNMVASGESRLRDFGTGMEISFGTTQTAVPGSSSSFIDLLSDGPNFQGTLSIYNTSTQTLATALGNARRTFVRQGRVVIATKTEAAFEFQKGTYVVPSP